MSGWTADIHQVHLQLIGWVKTTDTGAKGVDWIWQKGCRPVPNHAGFHGGPPYPCGLVHSWHFKASQRGLCQGPKFTLLWRASQTERKTRKPTPLACIDSCALGSVRLPTSQPWKAVLSQKVEAMQYSVVWIIDDRFLSNQCPHKTMHSLFPWWRQRAWPVFVPKPLEAQGKSFNALKSLEVLPLKDSPWTQAGMVWYVSPYEGVYQSGLPGKVVRWIR